MNDSSTVLVVEDDAAMRDLLTDELKDARYRIVSAADGHEAMEQLDRHAIDAVVTDLMMPGLNGDALLDQVRVRHPRLPVIIITAFGTIDTAVRAVKAGAFHFLPKPFRMAELAATLESALTRERESSEMDRLARDADAAWHGVIAAGAAMRRIREMVEKAATADTPVLLTGESGTGKELLARAMHRANRRHSGRFIAVNCSSIPEPMLDKLLFGPDGFFVEAAGGTIFLDEIGELSPALQVRLLRQLEARDAAAAGDTTTRSHDVRVVTASETRLADKVEAGAFRQDLYYRLSVIAIIVPPLRERDGEFLPLVTHFLKKHGERLERSGVTISPEALEVMRRHAWPGNVRELENVIERALVLGHDTSIGIADLPEGLLTPAGAREVVPPLQSVALVEREHILRTLRAVAGNKAAAARLLGFDRKTLYRKLKQYDIRHG